ncbi:MAG: CoA transferase [Rhodospirillaceae bacterium]|jgi:crotonobetainyl-CoA:carnitine CoA-transferase CaiB-like acyl-CoA transferase|nr:CoA transferase [Rhodospirillaceae bacterium]MBT6138215.1 CoA transferase [Rhodospirillaceae bacterium]
MNERRPYAGLRVLDLSQGIAAPYCGMLLAHYGADVIKVEPPGGDWMRGLGAKRGDFSSHSLVYNQGKRSLALDLKGEGALDIVYRLAKRSDIVLQSFRPGVADRLGVGYDDLLAINPALVYLSVSGFGQDGPGSVRPTTDTVVQAFSGLMHVNPGADGVPHRLGTTIIDALTGLFAFQAMAVELHGREKGEPGRHLDVDLMQAASHILAPNIIEHQLSAGQPVTLNAPAGSYRAKDGWIAIALVKEEHYTRLCNALERDDLATDPRYATFASRAEHLEGLKAEISDTVATRDRAEWLERLRDNDVLANAVNDFSDWLEDPQVLARGAAEPMAQDGLGDLHMPRLPTREALSVAVPRIGEHSAEVLTELEYGRAEVAKFISAGVVTEAEG